MLCQLIDKPGRFIIFFLYLKEVDIIKFSFSLSHIVNELE